MTGPPCVFPPYLGSQSVCFLRQALSLQEKLVLSVEQLHQLLCCGLAVLIQLLQSAEKRSEMGSEICLLWRASGTVTGVSSVSYMCPQSSTMTKYLGKKWLPLAYVFIGLRPWLANCTGPVSP